jgi:hypothetical protein
MTSFTITGTLKDANDTASVTWPDGVLSGNAFAVKLATDRADAFERRGAFVGLPTGPE